MFRVEFRSADYVYIHGLIDDMGQNVDIDIEGILPKGPFPPCVSMAGRALWQDTLDMTIQDLHFCIMGSISWLSGMM